jgi:hypothetical protein
MAKQDLVKKYRNLVKGEERRIKDLTKKAFSRLKHISSHPSLIRGRKGKSKYDPDSYQYLRQRYYRLKRIGIEDIKKSAFEYKFNDYFGVVKDFMKHFGINRTKEARELRSLLQGMTKQEMNMFLELGLNYDLRGLYEDMAKDVQTNSTTALDSVIHSLRIAKRFTHK